MSAVWYAALAGGAGGAGMVLIWYAATRPVESLSTVAESLDRATVRTRSGGRVLTILATDAQRRWAQELELCEESAARWVTGRILLSIELMLVPLVLWTTGVIGILPRLAPGGVWMFLAVLGAAAGWGLAVLQLKDEAKKRRSDFSDALASYTSLVAILVSGGSGVETAIEQAAKVGQGSTWRHLSSAIDAASARREPPWSTLRVLGERLGVEDLVDFGSSMELAAGGAHVVDALQSKTRTIHDREMNRELADAEAKSEAMVVPITLMLGGIFLLIGFPIMVALTRL